MESVAHLRSSLDVEVDIVAARWSQMSFPPQLPRQRYQAHLPPGAPPQFSEATCINPASPLPPVAPGLHVDSCIANEASMMG